MPLEQAPVQQLAARAASWQVAATLCQRELVRFLRQRNRVVGALVQPILFWVLLGIGFRSSFRMPGSDAAVDAISYSEFLFPGTLAMIVLFTAIFSTISVIEDRREGFMQSVLVAPVARWSMVLGKLLGGTLLAMLQAGIFLGLGYATGIRPGPLELLATVGLLFVLGIALTGLGFSIAWRMDSTQGFHAIMSVFLLPMWLLSGALFPSESGALYWIMRFNPLSYGVAGLRRLLTVPPEGLPSMASCWGISILFAVLMFALACRVARGRTTGDLL